MLVITCWIIGILLITNGAYFFGRSIGREQNEISLDRLFENIAEDESLTYWEKEFVFGTIYDHAPEELGIELPN